MNAHWHAPDGDLAIRVVHQIRGRLRLRVPARISEAVMEALRAAPGVTSAAWSPRTDSLLVLYDPDATAGPAILDLLRDLAEGEAGVAWEEQSRRVSEPTVASAVVGTVSEIDHRVRRSSRGMLRLGTLVPAALTLWAVTEIMRGRTGPLGWSSALWYAHGLFRDYNLPS
jgi:hypothetical protein